MHFIHSSSIRNILLSGTISVFMCTASSMAMAQPSFYSPLIKAADEGKLTTLQRLIEKENHPIDAEGRAGSTALIRAAYQGNEKIVRYLLQKGAAINKGDIGGTTPLHVAARQGNLAIVKQLIKAGASIDARDVDGWTPLSRAVSLGKKKVVKQLIEAGASTDFSNRWNESPVYLAAQIGHLPMLEQILTKETNISRLIESRNMAQENGYVAAAQAIDEAVKRLDKTATASNIDPNDLSITITDAKAMGKQRIVASTKVSKVIPAPINQEITALDISHKDHPEKTSFGSKISGLFDGLWQFDKKGQSNKEQATVSAIPQFALSEKVAIQNDATPKPAIKDWSRHAQKKSADPTKQSAIDTKKEASPNSSSSDSTIGSKIKNLFSFSSGKKTLQTVIASPVDTDVAFYQIKLADEQSLNKAKNLGSSILQQYPDQFSGQHIDIVPATKKGRYEVRAGIFRDVEKADQLCTSLLNQNQKCSVVETNTISSLAMEQILSSNDENIESKITIVQ